jgi:hypothetical protein
MRFLAFLNFLQRNRDGGPSTVADQGAAPSIAQEMVVATIGGDGLRNELSSGHGRGGANDGYQPF